MDPLKLSIKELQDKRSWMYTQQKQLLEHEQWENIVIDDQIESKMLMREDGLFPVIQATSTINISAEELFDYLTSGKKNELELMTRSQSPSEERVSG